MHTPAEFRPYPFPPPAHPIAYPASEPAPDPRFYRSPFDDEDESNRKRSVLPLRHRIVRRFEAECGPLAPPKKRVSSTSVAVAAASAAAASIAASARIRDAAALNSSNLGARLPDEPVAAPLPLLPVTSYDVSKRDPTWPSHITPSLPQRGRPRKHPIPAAGNAKRRPTARHVNAHAWWKKKPPAVSQPKPPAFLLPKPAPFLPPKGTPGSARRRDLPDVAPQSMHSEDGRHVSLPAPEAMPALPPLPMLPLLPPVSLYTESTGSKAKLSQTSSVFGKRPRVSSTPSEAAWSRVYGSSSLKPSHRATKPQLSNMPPPPILPPTHSGINTPYYTPGATVSPEAYSSFLLKERKRESHRATKPQLWNVLPPNHTGINTPCPSLSSAPGSTVSPQATPPVLSSVPELPSHVARIDIDRATDPLAQSKQPQPLDAMKSSALVQCVGLNAAMFAPMNMGVSQGAMMNKAMFGSPSGGQGVMTDQNVETSCTLQRAIDQLRIDSEVMWKDEMADLRKQAATSVEGTLQRVVIDYHFRRDVCARLWRSKKETQALVRRMLDGCTDEVAFYRRNDPIISDDYLARVMKLGPLSIMMVALVLKLEHQPTDAYWKARKKQKLLTKRIARFSKELNRIASEASGVPSGAFGVKTASSQLPTQSSRV